MDAGVAVAVALVCLFCAGCGAEPLPQVDLQSKTLILSDRTRGDSEFTYLIYNHQAVVLVDPGKQLQSVTAPRHYYAASKIDDATWKLILEAAALPGDKEPPYNEAESMFGRYIYPDVRAGELPGDSTEAQFTPVSPFKLRMDGIHMALCVKANEAAAPPNWVFAHPEIVKRWHLQ